MVITDEEFEEESTQPPTSVEEREEDSMILISKPELSSESDIDENIISLE